MKFDPTELDEEMLPNPTIQEISREIGTDNLLKVAKIIGGAEFYFPRKEKLLIQLRNQNIKKEFNGYNYLQLAHKYELTEQRIRQRNGKSTFITHITFAIILYPDIVYILKCFRY